MIYRFGESGEFELDALGFELRRGGALLEAEPKVLELLLHLVRHADRLVPREELLAEVWRDVRVEEDSLYRAVAIARRLLGQRDGADAPIRTVRGRGYRLVGEVRSLEAPAVPVERELPGRSGALAALRAALDRARSGRRQLLVISGEAGLGKTRLVDVFLEELRGTGGALATTGQCLVAHEGGEPYSPLLEALARLLRRAPDPVLAALRSRAPAWLAQLPGTTGSGDLALFESRARGATRERLTEELADALDEIAAHRPLVLVLEDLHACDRATLGLLAALAPLAEPDVAALVRARAGSGEPDAARVGWLARRSAGNPLFLHALLDSGAAPGDGTDVPESLAERIELQIGALDPDDARLLEVASAAGLEFSAAEAAAALDADLVAVEEACDELARRALFLTRSGVGEWPDGTIAARFRFRHALHREVLVSRVAPARARELHRRLAARLDLGHGPAAAGVAAVLADHYERAGDARAAVRHYAGAVAAAARRHAGHEAHALAVRALALVPRLPAEEAAEVELSIRFSLLPVLPDALGFGHAEVERNLARAQELCEVAKDGERRLAVLWSRCYARFHAGAPEEAVEYAEQLLRASQELGRPTFELLAHDALSMAHHKACRVAAALEHAEAVLARHDPTAHGQLTEWVGQDVGVNAAVSSAFGLWYLGRVAEATRRMDEALALARASEHGFTLVMTLCYAASFAIGAEDFARARTLAEEAMACAERERLPGHRWFALLLRAASLSREEGRLGAMVAALGDVRSFEAPQATGESGVRGLFAVALAADGHRELALAQIAEALAAADRSGERHHVPGLHLLRASLAQDDAEVERELETALDAARGLGLPLAQLQAATEVARFQARCARRDEARALLAPLVAARAGEPDVPILARARALLGELGPPA